MSSALLLSAEELLAGADVEHEVEIPREVFAAGSATGADPHETSDGDESRAASRPAPGRVRIRPLCLRDVQLIAKGAKDDEALTSILMIERALVEPELDRRSISRMPSGLVRFLVDQINRVSGLTSSDDEIRELAGAPLVQTFFILAKEFGWTPEEIRELTLGQVLGYLEMLNRSRAAAG